MKLNLHFIRMFTLFAFVACFWVLICLQGCGGSEDEPLPDTPAAPRNVCAPNRSNCV